MKATGLAMLAVLLAPVLALGGCQKVGSRLTCGGETFEVAFRDSVASVTSADKTTVSLPKLEQPAAAGTATVYTNGAMTFTQLTPSSGAAPVIKFARGKMAFQECQMAGN